MENTKCEPFYPSCMRDDQIKRLSFLIAQYTSVGYVNNIA